MTPTADTYIMYLFPFSDGPTSIFYPHLFIDPFFVSSPEVGVERGMSQKGFTHE